MGQAKEKIHPIILMNMQNRTRWYNTAGNLIDMFDGIDGKKYMAVIPPEAWTLKEWEQYYREGITVKTPIPVDEIVYPEDLMREKGYPFPPRPQAE